jgi:hypothetical protein
VLPTINNPEKFAVVAITRDEAKIWKSGIGPADLPIHVRPPIELDHRHKRTGQFKHGHDTAHRFPEYFEDVAEELREFQGILIMGHGKGNGSYGQLLLKYFEKKHPDLLTKVVDLVTFNISEASESELSKQARSWFEKNYRTLATWHDRPIDRRLL